MNVKKTTALVLSIGAIVALALPGVVAVPGETAVSVAAAPLPDLVRPAALARSAHYPPTPDVAGVSVLLLDAESGEILYERDADRRWPPASLTKLFTMYTALEEVAAGRFSLDTPHPVPPVAYASAMEPGSSLMFLGPNQAVTGRQLLFGLSVSSGNDAAVGLATLVSGSVDAFMDEVASDVAALGLEATRLVEPSGISADNVTTARDLARMALSFMQRWPEEARTYLARREFSYPASGADADRTMPTVTQRNRNTLLWDYPGADGMKTGYIDESGYNMVATAERDDRRLIAVVLGVSGANHAEGGAARAAAASELLDWGFDEFEIVRLSLPEGRPIAVLGSHEELAPRAQWNPIVALTPASRVALRGTVETVEVVWAPVRAETPVGMVRYLVDGDTMLTVPLIAGRDVARGALLNRIVDRYRLRLGLLFDNRGGETAFAQ